MGMAICRYSGTSVPRYSSISVCRFIAELRSDELRSDGVMEQLGEPQYCSPEDNIGFVLKNI